MTEASKKSRYPGIRSFEREEKDLFFGRDNEALDLFSTVKVKPLTVLFSKSGIGKTSLINAGLIPYLENDYFEPIKIRLQDTTISPVATVKEVLKPYLNKDILGQYAPGEPTMWEYLRACKFEKKGENFVPVLIFDQFEEFFNHEEFGQLSLNLALSDLVNERLPDTQQNQFRKIPRKKRTDADLAWYNPIDIRIVLAIRSDRMSALDNLKHYVPTILHDRFQLKPLQTDTARKAIVAPAEIANSGFSTASFQYEEDAIQTMLAALSNREGEIESFQLQLLCRYIEEQFQILNTSENHLVTQKTFGGKSGIDSILNDYYEREIEKLPLEDQTIARRFIEEGLIVEERRVGLGAGLEQSRFDVSENLLHSLLESRLIRAEQIHLGKIYELSHDTLVDPILKSYEKRRLAEERQEAQRKLKAEQVRLEDANQKKRQARLLAALGFLLFFLALLGGIFAFRNYLKSEEAKKAAEISEIQARGANLASKAWNVYRTDHTLALRLAGAALKLDSTNEEVLQTLRQIINLPGTSLYQSVFKGHAFEVTGIASFPDADKVVTVSFDTDLIIWDLEGNMIKRVSGKKFDENAEGHASSVTSVAVSPDGQYIFSGGADDLGKLWTQDGALIRDFEGHTSYVNAVAFSPDGQQLLTGSRDKTAKIWNLNGEVIRSISGHQADIVAVAFSPDGQTFLTGSYDGTARLWSINGQELRRFSFGTSNVLDVTFSPGGGQFLIACADHKAYLYSTTGNLEATLEGHSSEVSKVAFSPDGKILATASWDNTAKLWSMDGREIKTLKGHNEKVTSLCFAADGRSLFTGGFDFLAKSWDVALNLFDYNNPWHTSSITSLDVSEDNQRILTGSRDYAVKLWDLSGRLMQSFEGHQNRVLSVSFSPDEQQVLSSSLDKTAIIWNMDGTIKHRLESYESSVNYATYAPSGQWIATADGRDRTITLWTQDGIQQKKWKAGSSSIANVQFSSDGQQILSSGYDGFIRIWDKEGNLLDSMDNQQVPVFMAIFDPSDEGIWSVGQELPIKHWVGNEIKKKLFGSFDETYALDFHPNNTHFVTSCWDQTAKIWHTDGTLLQTLTHPDGVYGACFFPNGEYLATGCRDNFVRIWNMDGDLISALGIKVDIEKILNNEHIASLSQIPFSLNDFGLSEELAAIIFNDTPEELIRQGENLLEIATNQPGKKSASLENYNKAISLFELAARQDLPDSSDLNIPFLIANAYVDRTYLLLTHKNYQEALNSAQTGLRYHTIDFLQIFEILTLILDDQYNSALTKATPLKDQPTPGNEFYETFRQAFEEEIYYYRNDYGIDHPDFDRFLQAIAE